MIDMAGHKSLRKKWSHYFDSVAVVTYFVNLAAFDEFLEEEPQLNSLNDSLQNFIDVTHSQILNRTDFVLFFNKKDLFADKIKTSSLIQCFPYFKGKQSTDFCIRYVMEQFLQKKPCSKIVYPHICCAIDVPCMKDLLTDVIDCIGFTYIRRSRKVF
ncbi:Guanine nucleotide-binding protein G(i) subunit alpha-2 [Bulinus truncatus]|nr:Guanine nucleotide-binding protein G(i) subunit alpha-2 [Bulinus truncatus]